jgi:hypothetical protein
MINLSQDRRLLSRDLKERSLEYEAEFVTRTRTSLISISFFVYSVMAVVWLKCVLVSASSHVWVENV